MQTRKRLGAGRRGARSQSAFVFRTRGGKRAGAGRKPKGRRAGAKHVARPQHRARHPVHVTTRVVSSVGCLRADDLYLALREATVVTARRDNFRIVHMSIQRDHLHLIVEADDEKALSNGVRGFSISAAKQVNRAISRRGVRRTGRVIADCFHAHPLTSPRAVRNVVAYVLNNWRHHGEDRDPGRVADLDRFASGYTFPGWRELADSPLLYEQPPDYRPLLVWQPRVWLLEHGLQRYPAISFHEVPGSGIHVP